MNNAAYEVCSAIEACAGNKNVDFMVSLVIEALDAGLQA